MAYIKLNTILSEFDDKGTLLKWLKKVEKALKDGTIESVGVEPVAGYDNKIKLVFTSIDGTVLKSDIITIPKGEKGEKGDDGEKGDNGVGFGDALGILAPTSLGYTVTYDQTDGLTITGTFDIRTGIDTVYNIPIDFSIPIIAGEGVTMDADEDGKKLVVSATGSGGTQLYKHTVAFSSGSTYTINAISATETAYTSVNDLGMDFIVNHNILYMCTINFLILSCNPIQCISLNHSDGAISRILWSTFGTFVSDTVTPL